MYLSRFALFLTTQCLRNRIQVNTCEKESLSHKLTLKEKHI